MKHLIVVTAIIATLSTSAFAMDANARLPAWIATQVRSQVPNADMSNLSTAQVIAIVNLFNGRDGFDAGVQSRPSLEAILSRN